MKDSEILLLSKKKITTVAPPKQNSTHAQILGFSIITMLVLSQKFWVPHSQRLISLGWVCFAIIPVQARRYCPERSNPSHPRFGANTSWPHLSPSDGPLAVAMMFLLKIASLFVNVQAQATQSGSQNCPLITIGIL